VTPKPKSEASKTKAIKKEAKQENAEFDLRHLVRVIKENQELK
jgi:hypothetical protein